MSRVGDLAPGAERRDSLPSVPGLKKQLPDGPYGSAVRLAVSPPGSGQAPQCRAGRESAPNA